MKKHLFTCFLASLCLFGSTSTAQVADSPGADFLHRSSPSVPFGLRDTHRGGETRSDTLPEQNGLVDHSAAKGQESEGSSAQSEGFFTLKGEITPDSENPTQLSYELIQQELDPYYQLMDRQGNSLALQPGDFYAGTSGKQVFEFRIPMQEPFARFSLSEGRTPLLQNIWVQPGDSLLIHWNAKRSELFLSGPSANKVRIQRQLKEVALAESAGRNPVMLISDASVMLNTPEKQADYEQVVSDYLPAWSKKMELLETEAQRMDRAEYLFSAIHPHPVFTELARYRDVLPPELTDWLRLYWTGNLYNSALQFVRNCRPGEKGWGELLLRYSMDIPLLFPEGISGTVPHELAEALYLENSLLEKLLPVAFFQLSEAIPIPLREQVDAIYLVKEFKELPDADSLFTHALGYIRTPWIAHQLDALQHGNLKGQDFSAHGFLDQQGDTVYPEAWKGKLVIVDFWLSGCGACLSFARDTFLPIMEEFEDHPDVLFVTVAGDNDQDLWKKSLASGRYTSDQSINLYSGGTDHPTLRQNLIRSFPAQILLDGQGRILQSGSFPKNREGWSQLIQTYLDQGLFASQREQADILSKSNPKPQGDEK
ncbi:hypothetical protein [uncultured Algoriphagus sp.]|uniref:TlpA family protein disulfide reductase n=1 Tax=uncultured Algoriphagus sp. TaxID=417365 RepID=UPI0030EC1DCB